MKVAGTSMKPLELWRHDVHINDALDFGRSLAVSALRAGSGAAATDIGPRPEQRLVLYEKENCPYSRLAREALSHLDIDAVIKPCPDGESVHRAELRELSGQEQIPFLVDPNTGQRITDSMRIVRYLFKTYGHDTVPLSLRYESIAQTSSKMASAARHVDTHYCAPRHAPQRPLELWGYEASPYSRIVRERLSALGITYISHNLARHSPRRAAFVERYGKEQFPRLSDPNTGYASFESKEIVRYLDATYACTRATTFRSLAPPPPMPLE